MTTTTLLTHVDALPANDLRRMAAADEPWVSLLLPTARSGPQARAAATVLANLVAAARDRVSAHGVDPAVLEPAQALVEDVRAWDEQAEGLAVYLRPGEHRTYRLPEPLHPELAVGPPRLRPLVPLVDTGEEFYVLALAAGATTLHRGTRHKLTRVETDRIPASVGDLSSDRDHQTQLQHAPQGGGEATFHGHGADGSHESARLDRFLRHVARGLEEVLPSGSTAPVVLAGVSRVTARFATLSGRTDLVDTTVRGSAESMPEHELHAAAWAAVESARGVSEEERELWSRLVATGAAPTRLRDVVDAAEVGRVDTLLVAPPEPGAAGQTRIVEDDVDVAIAHALRSGAEVRPLPHDLAPAEAVAILRY